MDCSLIGQSIFESTFPDKIETQQNGTRNWGVICATLSMEKVIFARKEAENDFKKTAEHSDG
jgi:hypothetical protein